MQSAGTVLADYQLARKPHWIYESELSRIEQYFRRKLIGLAGRSFPLVALPPSRVPVLKGDENTTDFQNIALALCPPPMPNLCSPLSSPMNKQIRVTYFGCGNQPIVD